MRTIRHTTMVCVSQRICSNVFLCSDGSVLLSASDNLESNVSVPALPTLIPGLFVYFIGGSMFNRQEGAFPSIEGVYAYDVHTIERQSSDSKKTDYQVRCVGEYTGRIYDIPVDEEKYNNIRKALESYGLVRIGSVET